MLVIIDVYYSYCCCYSYYYIFQHLREFSRSFFQVKIYIYLNVFLLYTFFSLELRFI